MIKHVSPAGLVIFLHTFVIFEQLLAGLMSIVFRAL